jgi:hypothetical protein
MSVATFDELLECLRDKIAGENTPLRDCIPVEEKLIVTLRLVVKTKLFTKETLFSQQVKVQIIKC